jgi:hypothetical protein
MLLFATQWSLQARAPSIDVDSDLTYPTMNTRYTYSVIAYIVYYA